MAEVTIKTPLDCEPEQYFEGCLFDEDYAVRLFQGLLKFPGVKVLSLVKEGDKWQRKVHIDPPVTGLPGPVKKIVGDKFSYVEDGVYDRTAKRYSYSIVPSAAADKTRASGEAWCEKDANGKTVLVTKFNVEVKIFMVGGLIEQKIIDDLRASMEQAAPFIAQYAKEKGFGA